MKYKLPCKYLEWDKRRNVWCCWRRAGYCKRRCPASTFDERIERNIDLGIRYINIQLILEF